jgi:MoxR-like ATPase
MSVLDEIAPVTRPEEAPVAPDNTAPASVVTIQPSTLTGAQLQAQFASVAKHVNTQIFERVIEIRLIQIAMLIGEHVFFEGPPGCAKSELVDLLVGAFTDVVVFGTQFHPNKTPETLFGRLDWTAFRTTGQQRYITDNYLPGCHVAKLDEIWKGNPANHDPMLSILNERWFDNGGVLEQCPLIFALGTSNEFPESDESVAAYDRFLLRKQVSYLKEKRNRMKLLDRADKPAASPVTLTLADLLQAQSEVAAIQVPKQTTEMLDSIRTKLAAEGVQVSDRRFRKSKKVLQANAWLRGSQAAEEDDLEVLQYVFWDLPEQQPTVSKIVLSTSSPDNQELVKISENLAEITAGVKERDGQSEQSLMAFGAQSNTKLKDFTNKLAEIEQKLTANGRSTKKLEEVRGQMAEVRALVFEKCLGVTLDGK